MKLGKLSVTDVGQCYMLYVVLILLASLSILFCAKPANAQSFYEAAPQNDLRNLAGAMDYYRLFSRDDSYNGATKQELRSWGATHSSGVNIVVQITDGGKHYEATAQHVLGGREFSYTTGPDNFNGLPPRRLGPSSPQPTERPTEATMTIYQVGEGPEEPTEPPSEGPDPDRADDFGECVDGNPACGGDPVNFTTGNMYEIKEDLNLPGKGFPLQFVRTYNSQDTLRGPLGYGWTHNYNAQLEEDSDGSVTEIDPEGRRLTFTSNADGTYAAPGGYEDKLTKEADGSFTLKKKNGFVWSFGGEGRLKKISGPNGNTMTFSYTNGNLTGITDTAGRETTLVYNADGRITKLTDPSGSSISYAYDNGNLVSITDQAGKELRYSYGGRRNLTQITDKKGNVFSFAYDDQDRVSSTVGENGTYEMNLAYDEANNKTTVTDSKNNRSIFHYNEMERVTKIVDPLGNETNYTFNAEGNRASETDELGNTTNYSYDEKSNLTRITYPNGDTWQATYGDPFNSLKSETDPTGSTTTYTYDANGNPTAMTDALQNETTFEYEASGQLTRSVDAKGRATTYAYDDESNLTTLTDPKGSATNYSYGALGKVTQTTDALGRSTTLDRDAMSRITAVTHPGGATERFGYDANGNPTSYTDERGSTWSTAYNSVGKPTSETDPLGNKTTYTYDTEANLTRITDPKGKDTTMEYNALTRLTKMTIPDGTTAGATTTFNYDAAGRMTGTTDPKGKTTNYSYSPLDRLTRVTDAKGGEAAYAYDPAGRMTEAVNPNGNAKTYTYDALGRLTEETDPLGRIRSYTYDKVGNVTGRTDAKGKETGYSYDDLDRLTATNYPDASKIEMSYDAVGNLTTLTDKTGATNYNYDNRDRLTEEAFPQGTIQQSYDAAGNHTGLTYPGGGKASYTYDAASRMTAATAPGGAETTYAYDKLDRITETTYPNGAGEAFAYDPIGRVTAARATATGTPSTVLEELTYAYDKNSNVTSITDKEGEESTFAYDELDRLKRESHRYRSYAYTYDPAGNRTGLDRTTPNGTKTTNYTYDGAEQMTKAGDTTYSYDANGNLTKKTIGQSTTDYTYDFEDRITKAGDTSYTYDAFGRKVSSQSGETTTDYLYDGLEAIQQSTGPESSTYLRGPGNRLISREQGSGSPSYYHHDSIGSVTALSGSEGNLTDTYGYTAFGTQNERSGESEQPYTYLANAYDPATKLYDFHARQYDASAGRFMSEDPVAGITTMPQTLNPYPYGVNNPLAYPDPDGEIAPALLVVPVVVYLGRNALQSGTISAGSYYLTHRADKGGINRADFLRTVGRDAVFGSVNPLGGAGKVSKVLKASGGGADDVARNFPRPPVRDTSTEAGKKLDDAFENLFRRQDKTPGGTADYIRRVGDSGHITKGKARARQLERLIESEKLSAADKQTAQHVRNDLINALKSQGQWP